MRITDYLSKIPLAGWLKRSSAISVDGPSTTTSSNLIRAEKNSSTNTVYLHPEVNYLTNLEKKDLLLRANKARLEFKAAKSQTEQYYIIQNYFGYAQGRPKYLRHPAIQQFVIDSEQGDYYKTRALLTELRPNFILGVFQAPTAPELKKPSLEAMTFTEEDLSQTIIDDYPSNAVAIKDVAFTPGFSNEVFVALFPENFVVKDKELQKGQQFSAYYITDTFVKRFQKYTLPILERHAPAAFAELRNISPENLRTAVGTWLSAHEHFHTTGPIPRVYRPNPDEQADVAELLALEAGFEMKGWEQSGALEEMRADLNSILSVSGTKGKAEFGEEASPIRNFILYERLLRYPAQKNPEEHFDSIVAVVMLNFLRNFTKDGQKAVNINYETNQIALGDYALVTEALQKFLDMINSLEAKVAKKFSAGEITIKEARDELENFMRELGRPKDDPTRKDDANELDLYKSGALDLKEQIKKADDSKLKENLEKDLSTIRTRYFEHFYPLTDFHKALRKTYQETVAKLPRPKEINFEKQLSPNLKKTPTIMTIGDLHKDPAKPIDYSLPIVIADSFGVESLNSALKGNATRDQLDEAYCGYLNKLQQPSDLESPEATLQTLAEVKKKIDNVEDDLLFYVNLDLKKRLDAEKLEEYDKQIKKTYSQQFKVLKTEIEKKEFIENIKRVLRYKWKVTESDTCKLVLERGKTHHQHRDNIKKTTRRTALAIGLPTALALIFGLNELVKIPPKQSINDTDFKGLFNQDLEQLREHLVEGPLISRIVMSILTTNLQKNRFVECDLNKNTGLIDTTLSRDGEKLKITCSTTQGTNTITVDDNQNSMHVNLPLELIPKLNIDDDTELTKALLQMRKERNYNLEINPKFLPIRHPHFTMVSMSPDDILKELKDDGPIIIRTANALLDSAKNDKELLKFEFVQKNGFYDLKLNDKTGKNIPLKFLVRSTVLKEGAPMEVVILNLGNFVSVNVPNKITAEIAKQIETDQSFSNEKLLKFLEKKIQEGKINITVKSTQ